MSRHIYSLLIDSTSALFSGRALCLNIFKLVVVNIHFGTVRLLCIGHLKTHYTPLKKLYSICIIIASISLCTCEDRLQPK